MVETSDVVIAGGGVAGCAVAYYLAKAGVRATIVEREGVGTQASGYSSGGLNPLQGAGIPGPLGPLAMESFRMHREMWGSLRSESAIEFGPRTVSIVRVAFDDSEIPELEETHAIFQAADGFSAHWMSGDDVRALDSRISPGVARGLYTYGNTALDSYLYTLALSKAAERLGATVRRAAVRGLRTASGRVTGVLLEDGEVACDAVVLATGPWSRQAGDWLGVPLPVEPLKGEHLRTELPGAPLDHEFSGGHVSVYHRWDGLVRVGATEESRGFDLQPSESARKTLLEGATRLMPAMAEAKIVKHTACLRPVTPDWLPIIGRTPGWENVYMATGAGKKGILIGPGMGKAIADLITLGTTQLSVGSFGPERFGDSESRVGRAGEN